MQLLLAEVPVEEMDLGKKGIANDGRFVISSKSREEA
jgi:hypothetical protein